eukprot:GGOE01013878.1.p1 GENE.GGOE01013878.1~~GGOE01013878.1.p1  ORF type:complete len:215 (-),score=52.00 GGOE01013878.1:287-904(-)
MADSGMSSSSPSPFSIVPMPTQSIDSSAINKVKSQWLPRDPALGGKKQKRERDVDDLVVNTLTRLPSAEESAALRIQSAALEANADPPSKRHKAAWRPPPVGTQMFQISMEKLQAKPVKGRKSVRKLDNLMQFGDPQLTIQEEKDRVKDQKRWHREVEQKRRQHRKSKKERLATWLAHNEEAKELQETTKEDAVMGAGGKMGGEG